MRQAIQALTKEVPREEAQRDHAAVGQVEKQHRIDDLLWGHHQVDHPETRERI